MTATGLRSRLRAAVLSALVVAVGLPFAPAPASAADPEPIRYTYDALGRLTGVVDPPAGAATYKYDAAGNVTSIGRQSISATSILEFTPDAGAAGTTVTIEGTGFSATAGQNTVTFNGTQATVTAASATHLVASVPAGAASGPISVTSPSGTATSSASFSVRDAGVPAISSFSPTIGTPGTSVTISGSRFEPAANDNRVVFGIAHAPLSAASSTSLTATAPPTGSGLISVRTPSGKDTSSGYFFIPPEPYGPTDVQYTGSMAPGETETVTVSSAGKIGLVVFEGTVGQRITLNVTNVSVTHNVSILKPDGLTFAAPRRTTASGQFFDTMTLPVTGTYTVFIDPESDGTGSVRLALYDVPADASATITPGGPSVTVSTTAPGQNAKVTFEGSLNQRISLNVASGVTHSLTILRPDGSTYAGPYRMTWGGFIDTRALDAAGTYTIRLDPEFEGTGSVTLTLYEVPADASASITPGGPSVTVTMSTPGQNGKATFEGSLNQRISLNVASGVTHRLTILRPDGSTFSGPHRLTWGGFIDTRTLDVAGTYTIYIDPEAEGTGNVTLTLYDVPPDASKPITPGGPSVTVGTTVPGQNAKATFEGSLNQRISLNVASGVTHRLTILRPDGSPLTGTYRMTWGGFLDTRTLDAAGTYTIYMDPEAEGTGNVSLTLYDVPADASGSVTVGGPAVTLAMSTPGQNGKASFEGSAGQKVRLTVSAVTVGESDVSILKPDGSALVGPTYVTPAGRTIDATLAVTGTHTVSVNPRNADTGNVTLQLAELTAAAPQTTQLTAVADPEPRHARIAAASSAALTASRPPAAAVGGVAGPGTETGGERQATHEGQEEWIPGARNFRGDWSSGRPKSRWEDQPALTAAKGETALSGLVLRLNGLPLAGVTIAVKDRETRTDATGRFLLKGIAGGRHELVIDGRSASRGSRTYGLFEASVLVKGGTTNVLPYTIWMPKLDTAHTVAVDFPTREDIVLTTPRIPGLQVRIPAGSKITDEEGRPVTDIGITPIPIDRTPFPLPANSEIPVYFTVQPGGAYVEAPGGGYGAGKGARVIYPNYTKELPGTKTQFWSYDPEGKSWYVYGLGTVDPEGRRVVPDPGVVVHEFTGFMFSTGRNPPSIWPTDDSEDGDPVNLATGLFVLDKTDLVLPGVVPLALTRTYRPGDGASRFFGIGATHAYEMFLWSALQYQEVDLVLPDGERIHYVRISPGTHWTDAVFEHTSTPTGFYKSQITWNGNGWDLRLKDGTVYVFGENAPLQAIRDRNGNTVTLIRTSGQTGNISQINSPSGRWLKFSYDASNRITQVSDNAGRTVGYAYDASGRLWKVTDPAGGVTEYSYDASHRMTTIKDARGIVFLTNEYDANGRVTKQTQADSTTYEFAYTLDGSGKVTRTDVTDPRGNVRRVTFNASGYTLSDTRAVGKPEEQRVSYARGAGSNRVTSVTDALSRGTDFGYDAAGNLTSVTRLAGTANAVTTSMTYEPAFNQLASVTDPLDHATSFSYDRQGNLTKITDPRGKPTTFTYNPAGQPLTVTDATGKKVTLTYDLGDLVEATDQLGNKTRRFIDGAGRLAALTDALGALSRVEYEARNLPTKSSNALGGTTTFSYDANANLLTLTDPRNGATTYTYDDMDRVVTRKDPLLATETYAYDAAGHVTKVTDRKAQATTYSYDALGRRTFVGFKAVTSTEGVTSYESTITYTYDAANRLTRAEDSANGTISLAYDDLDRMTSETNPAGSVTYAYDDASRRTGMTVAGQSAVSYTHDAADRLTEIKQGSATVGLGYDDAGRRTSVTLPNGIVGRYGYDNASRLTGLSYALGETALGSLTYAYDAAGRRSTVGGSFARTALPAAQATTAYDAANRLTKWGLVELTYDANGNLTSDGTSTYAWNARDELTSITGPAIASFTYDAFGRRASKTVNGLMTTFRYDGANAVEEARGTGLPGVAPLKTTLLSGGVDEYFTRSEPTGTRSYLADGLGSTTALTNSAGSVQTEYAYEPFGKATSTGIPSDNAFQYTGRENDGTGLYYYRARYYHPTYQRFISEDPIGFAGGDLNLYAYVWNTPTRYTDPSGQCGVDAAVDLAFIAWDLWNLATGSRKDRHENLQSLGLNLIGLAVPCASGLGLLTKADEFAELGRAGNRASDASKGSDAGKACSFSPDTRVATAAGSEPIANLKKGSVVLSYDQETGRVIRARVVAVAAHDDVVIQRLRVDGEEIETTPDHPFYTLDSGWVRAGELRLGARLRRADGTVARVQAVSFELGPRRMWDITVSTTRNYFVGRGAVQVHNCPTDGGARPPRATPISPSESPIWNSPDLRPHHSGLKKSGRGKNTRYWSWDYKSGEIEVFDRRGRHLGALDPKTGDPSGPAVPGRTIKP